MLGDCVAARRQARPRSSFRTRLRSSPHPLPPSASSLSPSERFDQGLQRARDAAVASPPPPPPPKPVTLLMTYPGLTLLHPNPRICIIENFLDNAECMALIQCAEPFVKASGMAFGGSEAAQNIRTSSTVLLRRSRTEVKPLHSRVGRLLGKPIEHCEDPQVSRYRRGEFYKAHFDGPGLEEPTSRPFLICGGQRVATVLVYLNDVESGGATGFPLLNLEVRPKRGRALVFFPVRSHHARSRTRPAHRSFG